LEAEKNGRPQPRKRHFPVKKTERPCEKTVIARQKGPHRVAKKPLLPREKIVIARRENVKKTQLAVYKRV